MGWDRQRNGHEAGSTALGAIFHRKPGQKSLLLSPSSLRDNKLFSCLYSNE